jgi:hypothetical protein
VTATYSNLAYYDKDLITEVMANVLKLFKPVMGGPNKLECLYLTGLQSLVQSKAGAQSALLE